MATSTKTQSAPGSENGTHPTQNDTHPYQDKIDNFLDQLEGVEKRGHLHWAALCPHPKHDDHEPSFFITAAEDYLLVICHPCGKEKTSEILGALGMTFADLYFDSDSHKKKVVAWKRSLDPSHWHHSLTLNKDGSTKATILNMATILSNDDYWSSKLWWDDVHQVGMLNDAVLSDAHMMAIARWIDKVYALRLNTTKLLEPCVIDQCRVCSRDLLKEFIDELPVWDGVKRLTSWLYYCAGVKDNKYTRDISRLLPVSMIARALNPGCQYRYVVILQGLQNSGKSKLVEILAGGKEWYIDIAHDLGNKEAKMLLRGMWVAELSELDAMKKTEETAMKAFVTQKEDTWIPKFSNYKVTHSRRTILIGTTNESVYLKDQTGSTRYLPVNTGTIKPYSLAKRRDQIFAEALRYYKNHPRDWWQLSSDGEVIAKEEREDRREPGIYESDIAVWLHHQQKINGGIPKNKTTVREIAIKCLKLDAAEKRTRVTDMDIAKSLRGMSFERGGREVIDDVKERVWIRHESTS
jgi:predicted P-loop ATPase